MGGLCDDDDDYSAAAAGWVSEGGVGFFKGWVVDIGVYIISV